jgi:hypothetical protein
MATNKIIDNATLILHLSLCSFNMPGHVKLGKPGEPDPDPAPYLIVSLEMKREDMLKPYDPKRSVWVPTDDHGFREGLLESDDGTKAVVMCGHEVGGIFLRIFKLRLHC